MPRAEASVLINRAPTDVFEFLADGTNDPRWRDGVIEIALVSGHGVDSVYKQTMRGPGGRKIAGDYRITEFEPPHRLSFQVIAGPARPTGTFVLEPVRDGATELTFTLDVKPTGFMKLASPMISRQVRREVDAIQRLKEVLETPT